LLARGANKNPPQQGTDRKNPLNHPDVRRAITQPACNGALRFCLHIGKNAPEPCSRAPSRPAFTFSRLSFAGSLHTTLSFIALCLSVYAQTREKSTHTSILPEIKSF
jgi:hypothetical protein